MGVTPPSAYGVSDRPAGLRGMAGRSLCPVRGYSVIVKAAPSLRPKTSGEYIS